MALKLNPDLPLIKYYDKVLAVAVLIFLLISLSYLTSAGAKRKSDEDRYVAKLAGLTPSAPALQPNVMEEYAQAVSAFRVPLQLEVPTPQNAGFLTPERRVSCVSVGCEKPIPYAAEVCPFCGAQQPVPTESDPRLDQDGDRIPDRIELAWGLNPQDPADARGDLDGDGFSNLDEFLADTDPRDPKSHPELVHLLRVKEIRGKAMSIIFSGVNRMPDGAAQLVFNILTPQSQTVWIREGEDIGTSGYKAGSVKVKSEERDNPNMPGIRTRVDVSTVVVKRLADMKEFNLRINEGEKSTDVEAVLVLPLDNTEYTVLEGGTFKLRDESYRVIAVDRQKMTVMVEHEISGKQKLVLKLD